MLKHITEALKSFIEQFPDIKDTRDHSINCEHQICFMPDSEEIQEWHRQQAEEQCYQELEEEALRQYYRMNGR